jgi:riboflavin synthase
MANNDMFCIPSHHKSCSISVNGVCLTATELDFDNKQFTVGLAPETLRKTNLGSYDPTSSQNKHKVVNLERASEIGGRNSGHFVQGHVDNVGTIIDQWVDDNSLFFKVMFPKEFMRYIVPKGFIAIDGTSLTVCDVHTGDLREDNWFTFMLVEYTQKKIILPFKEVGDTVNIEVDVLSKYSERAWEAFVPKMEALEEKVRELEGRLAEVEGRKAGVVGSATVGDSNYTVKYGDIIPQSPERKNGEVDGDEIDGLVNKDRKTVSSERWVRSEQSFLNKNY